MTSNSNSNAKIQLDQGPVVLDKFEDVRVKYRVDPKEIGHGHYGTVRRCKNRETDVIYAIKTIKKSKVNRLDILKREVALLKEVKHPNIIELVDLYEDENYLHLVTELCTGGELFDRIIEKTKESHDSGEFCFSEKDATILMKKILSAVEYCHVEKGIVHRDLKPENFLFKDESEHAEIKIIDFGLSRHDDENSGIMNTKVGTPYYVAPEVLSRCYTKACDMWSVGVISYILLCGYPPFYGDSDSEIFFSVRAAKFGFHSPEWDNISDLAKDFISKLLLKNPLERMTASDALDHPWIVGERSERGFLRLKSRRSVNFYQREGKKKLRKAAIAILGNRLTRAEIEKVDSIFRLVDTDKNGEVNLNDLDQALTNGSLPADVLDELRALRQKFYLEDDSFTFSSNDFLTAAIDKNLISREEKLHEVFQAFDLSGTNTLTLCDLIQVFGSEAQAREVMGECDINNDGEISYEEFKKALFNASST